LSTATITLTDPVHRVIKISSSLQSLLELSGGLPVWIADKPGLFEDLAACLLCASHDSGLPNPLELSAEAIRHSYIIYLVRQGLRLSDLEQIVGYVDPIAISEYSTYSPPQKAVISMKLNCCTLR